MTVEQLLKVIPNGIIQGGSVTVRFYEDVGIVRISSVLSIGMAEAHEVSNQKSMKIDPGHLLSANMKVGTTMQIGKLKLNVCSVAEGKAKISIVYDDGFNSGGGCAVVDTTKQFVSLVHLIVNGSYNRSAFKFELAA